MAAANEISTDAAVMAVLSELDGIYTLKDEQKWLRKLFLFFQHDFSLLLTGIGKSLNTAGHVG